MRLFASKRIAPGLRVGMSIPVTNRRRPARRPATTPQRQLAAMRRQLTRACLNETQPRGLSYWAAAVLVGFVAGLAFPPLLLLDVVALVVFLVLSVRWLVAAQRLEREALRQSGEYRAQLIARRNA